MSPWSLSAMSPTSPSRRLFFILHNKLHFPCQWVAASPCGALCLFGWVSSPPSFCFSISYCNSSFWTLWCADFAAPFSFFQLHAMHWSRICRVLLLQPSLFAPPCSFLHRLWTRFCINLISFPWLVLQATSTLPHLCFFFFFFLQKNAERKIVIGNKALLKPGINAAKHCI